MLIANLKGTITNKSTLFYKLFYCLKKAFWKGTLFLVHHLLVKCKLWSLKDNTITASGLTRSAGNLGEQTTRSKLVVMR